MTEEEISILAHERVDKFMEYARVYWDLVAPAPPGSTGLLPLDIFHLAVIGSIRNEDNFFQLLQHIKGAERIFDSNSSFQQMKNRWRSALVALLVAALKKEEAHDKTTAA